jgi:hypothetical protein
MGHSRHRRNAVRGAVAALLVTGAVVAGQSSAQAIPIANPGQSVTYTFYSDASRTVEVGWWSYGDCGEPFDFGTHTNYFSIRYVTCGLH